MQIEERFSVAAPRQRVWDVSVDIARWPEWNPTVDRVEVRTPGPMRTGWTARLKQPGNAPGTWTVTRVEEPGLFEWETRTLGMVVTARHVLADAGDATDVTLSIDVTGPATFLFGWIVARVSRKFLPMEAAGLRAECERA
ncbi:MAG: SRPBCC family protein [Dehalococcoidia bacterium]